MLRHAEQIPTLCNFEALYKDKMNKTLREIAQIKFGYYAKPTDGDGIPYLQAKQFDSYGNMIMSPDTYLEADNKAQEQLLADGDVLFAGKGYKHFAWCYRSSFGMAIASTIFFVITPDESMVLPEYLTALLNNPKNQLYFQHLASGSSIPSIRKSELAEFKVPVLPLAVQTKLVDIYELHKKDALLTMELMARKSELYESVFDTLTSK